MKEFRSSISRDVKFELDDLIDFLVIVKGKLDKVMAEADPLVGDFLHPVLLVGDLNHGSAWEVLDTETDCVSLAILRHDEDQWQAFEVLTGKALTQPFSDPLLCFGERKIRVADELNRIFELQLKRASHVQG